MRNLRLRFLSLVAATFCLAGVSLAAEKAKDDKVTLEDIIFDASYLKKMLGPNTLVAPAKPDAETLPVEVAKAIKDAGLDEKSRIFVLPKEAVHPKLTSSIPISYPASRQLGRDPIRADFLALLGSDGSVKCLYCYNQNDKVYAIAAAAALVKWRYTPVKIQDKAVPVVAVLPMEFNVDDATVEGFKRPRDPGTVQAIPRQPMITTIKPSAPK